MSVAGIFISSINQTKEYYEFIKNSVFDLIYGYVEVKCANKLCNVIYKLSRNSQCVKHNMSYACNMGCSLSAFNQNDEE